MIIGIVILVIFFGVLLVVGVKSKVVRNFFKYKAIEEKNLSEIEVELLNLINNHRKSVKASPLISEVLASKICRIRVEKDTELAIPTSHVGWAKMVSDAKVNVDNGSHIHGSYYVTAKDLFNAYMKSPYGHKEAIENKDRTHIGISFKNKRNHCLIVKY